LGDGLLSLANTDGASAKLAATPPTDRRKLRLEVAATAALARHVRHMVFPPNNLLAHSGREPDTGQCAMSIFFPTEAISVTPKRGDAVLNAPRRGGSPQKLVNRRLSGS
jgi:hypothetical protein